VHIEAALKKAKVVESRIIPMAQGQKQSRLVAWTFCANGEREKWRRERWSSAPAGTDARRATRLYARRGRAASSRPRIIVIFQPGICLCPTASPSCPNT
jgi:hypothetical protein